MSRVLEVLDSSTSYDHKPEAAVPTIKKGSSFFGLDSGHPVPTERTLYGEYRESLLVTT